MFSCPRPHKSLSHGHRRTVSDCSLSLKGLPLLRTLLHTLSALTRHGGECIDAVTQPGLGLEEEVPGGQAPVLFCALPTHPPPAACLLQGQEPPLGEEVQSVTNWAIFITAVSGLGEEGRAGEGAEEQPLQLALQTRTCSAESVPAARANWRETRRQGPQPQPACLPLACRLAFQIRSKGTSLSYLPPARSYDYLGAFGEGRSGWAQAPPSLDEGLPCQPSPHLIEKEQDLEGPPSLGRI